MRVFRQNCSHLQAKPCHRCSKTIILEFITTTQNDLLCGVMVFLKANCLENASLISCNASKIRYVSLSIRFMKRVDFFVLSFESERVSFVILVRLHHHGLESWSSQKHTSIPAGDTRNG